MGDAGAVGEDWAALHNLNLTQRVRAVFQLRFLFTRHTSTLPTAGLRLLRHVLHRNKCMKNVQLQAGGLQCSRPCRLLRRRPKVLGGGA
jgi:hypothetical protein